MKTNKISIRINKPANEVFAFYINPKNTPRWLNFIVKEETNQWPIKKGTIYRNKNKNGKWSEYRVTVCKENEIFELMSKDKNYHVRYTHKPVDNKTSELEYYEWVGKGDLEEPFTLKILKKLKQVLEDYDI